mgnify:CR=1 FL=1
MPGKFVIVDGSSLMHRAFYALPLLTTGSGQYTNAVYGFTTMLVRLLEDVKPDQMAVAFDKGKITFRNDLYDAYKGQRKGTPKELSEQFTAVRDVLDGFGIAVLEIAGYEGDDIIGTLAAQGEKEGYEVIVVTGDRDALQLITDQTKVLLTKKGISEMEMMDSAAVLAKYGVTPAQIADLKGLMGDASDNIPGVPGVGEKTATKLIAEYGCVENLLSQVDSVSGKKLQETLRTHAESAILSKKLATIVCHVPLENVPDRYDIQIRPDTLRELFTKLEFKTLLNRLPSLAGTAGADPEGCEAAVLPAVRPATSSKDVRDLAKAAGERPLAVLPILSGTVPEITITGVALCAAGDTLVIMAGETGWSEVVSLLADEAVAKSTHDSKRLLHGCRAAGVALSAVVFDTLLAGYLLDPIASDYAVPLLSEQYLGEAVPWNDKTHQGVPAYYAWGAQTVSRLVPVMEEILAVRGLSSLYQTIEMPLAGVLAAMEAAGITVDGEALRAMSADIGIKLEELLKDIYTLAGEEFNVNSTKQLGLILFEKLKLPVIKKTKTGYSTDAEVLETLAGKHEIIDKLLTYRMWTKLKSTYLDGIEGLIGVSDRRIHSTFNQTVTATGRLSSSEPNLQNIPIRSEAGRKIRELFVPGAGYRYLVTADYSQIELRVLAHISGDATMKEAFCQNQDIHSRTAAEVFGVPMDQVTSEMRSRAKAVNFGIVYGISDYGLSRDIGVSRKEAATYIDSYFARYPGVKAFMDSVVQEAKTTGYVATLFGRRRYLPDINSSNYNLRSFAERTAMNTPIQGTAADVIKKAMIDVYRALAERGLSSRLLLQVHDELVLEVKENELEEVRTIVKEAMENAAALDVDLVADVKYGVNWAAAK